MAISENRARELAGMLPAGLSFDRPRERLLCLAELLRALTDEGNRLSNADIRAVIAAYTGGWSPAENTVNEDLSALRGRGILGYRAHTSPSGSWMENERLPLAKMRLLLNAVQSSRFLTTKQCAGLQDDFADMVSRNQEETLLGEVFVVQRARKERQEAFEAIEVVSRAIREKRKVEFEYTYSGFDGKPHVLAGDDGARVRIETPIGLAYSEGNYYLESYSEKPWRRDDRVTRSRVDRMYNVRVSAQEEDGCAEVRRLRKTLARRVERETEMVGGTTRTVFLRVRADMTNVMFDKFGFGLRFAQFEGEKDAPDSTAVTCVRATQSFTFFRWLSSAGDGIVIARPGSEARVKGGPWPADVRQCPLDQLVEDYEAMRDGYLAYLARAMMLQSPSGNREEVEGMPKKRSRVPKGGPVWHRTPEQATLDRMPKYNAHACGTGAHGDAKYNRAKQQRSWRRELDREARNRGPLPLMALSASRVERAHVQAYGRGRAALPRQPRNHAGGQHLMSE